MGKLKLLSDQAIGEHDNSKTDGLGFHTYAKVLGDAAAGTTGPFTIGVFGEWGSGKTSLLRLTQKHLEENNNIITIWFNAWRFEQEDHPIVPLVATIVQGLENFKSEDQKLKGQLKSFVRGLKAVAYGFSAKSKIKIPGFAEIEAGFVAKDMIDHSDKQRTDPLLDKSLYFDAFETLSKIEIDSEFKVVVLIDDLDRCFPDNAVKLLESIKLVLSQKGFVFILGVARTIIEGYLQHRFEKEFGLKGDEGSKYLDKMVQLPFPIPPHDQRMENFSNSLIEQLEIENSDAFKVILPIIGTACGNNPRTTIRFVNNLLIDCEIFNEINSNEDDKIPIGYFAISRSLQSRWEYIFDLLIKHKYLCAEIIEWINKNKIPIDSPDDKIRIIAKKCNSDPELYKLLSSGFGEEWLSNDIKRTTTTQFLMTQRKKENYSKKLKSFSRVSIFNEKSIPQEFLSKLIEMFNESGYNHMTYSDSFLESFDPNRYLAESYISNSLAFLFFIDSNIDESLYRKLIEYLHSDKFEQKEILLVILPGLAATELPEIFMELNYTSVLFSNFEEIDENVKIIKYYFQDRVS